MGFFYGALSGSKRRKAQVTKNTASLIIIPRPRNFYLLGSQIGLIIKGPMVAYHLHRSTADIELEVRDLYLAESH